MPRGFHASLYLFYMRRNNYCYAAAALNRTATVRDHTVAVRLQGRTGDCHRPLRLLEYGQVIRQGEVVGDPVLSDLDPGLAKHGRVAADAEGCVRPEVEFLVVCRLA